VKESLDVTTNHNHGRYSYLWWHACDSTAHDFLAAGLLGQYVYVAPEKNIVIVRLGKKPGTYAIYYERNSKGELIS
jgi:CubicO group peptidase (beta-lactamase class C family)